MRARAALLSLVAVACSHAAEGARPSPVAVALPNHVRGPLDPPGNDWRLSPAGAASEQARCVDRELRARSLDEAGDPEPALALRPLGLGASTDAYRAAMRKRPDVATSCTRAPGEPER